MTRLVSTAWNNGSRQGWQLFCALVPCSLALLALQPTTAPVVLTLFAMALCCQLATDLTIRPGNSVRTRSTALLSQFFFNALLLALLFGLFVRLPDSEHIGVTQSATLATSHFLRHPIALGCFAAVLSFLGLHPLFNRSEAGAFSLPALAIGLTLTLAGLTHATAPPAPTPVHLALATGVCWLCWLRLLRLRPIACFLIAAIGVTLVFEPNQVSTAFTQHSAALAIMPLFVARLELSPAANNDACLAGFIAGLVYVKLSVFSGALYSPLFALCVATLFSNALLPLCSSLLSQATNTASRRGITLAIVGFSLSAFTLLNWLVSEGVTAEIADPDTAGSVKLVPLGLAGLAFISAVLTHFLEPTLRGWMALRRLRQREAIEASGQTVLRARVTGALHPASKD